MAKLVKKHYYPHPFEQWEFDNMDELITAAEKEAVVCGDVRCYKSDGTIEIFNHHPQAVRWIGVIK